MENVTQAKEKKPAGPSDHLANERTFLAWIRTSISLMGFGFVIVKFALFIKQISFAIGKSSPNTGKGYSAITGVIMVALGALLAVLAYLRYRTIERQLNTSDYAPSNWLLALVTVVIIVGALLLVLYLVPNIKL